MTPDEYLVEKDVCSVCGVSEGIIKQLDGVYICSECFTENKQNKNNKKGE
jgi:ribosomal protein S14